MGTMITAIAGSFLFASAATVSAAAIPLYPSVSGQSSGDTGEGRWTYIEVLHDESVTQIGIILNPSSPTDRFRWAIYSTTTVGSLMGLIFEQTVSYTDDDALTVKDIDTSIALTSGSYVLGLTTLDAPWQIMGGPNSVSGGYFAHGFVTADGNFRLWDAGVSSPMTPLTAGNSVLLAGFSVTATSQGGQGLIPSAATTALLAVGLAAFSIVRRTKMD